MRALIIAILIVAILVYVLYRHYVMGTGEGMPRIYRGVSFYNTGADMMERVPTRDVSAAILARDTNTYDEGGYVSACNRCSNSISCPQCPQFKVSDMGAGTATMAGISGAAAPTDTNVAPGTEYMCAGNNAYGQMHDRCLGKVNGGSFHGDGRFSLDCVNEMMVGGDVDMGGSPSSLSDMSLLDATSSGGGENFCAGGYKCADLAPNGPHNDAAHIRDWHEMRPECHSAVTPGMHYIPPPGMFGYRHDIFSDVSFEANCSPYRTRVDELLYKDIMELDADGEPVVNDDCEIFSINGYSYRTHCQESDIKSVLNENARIMSERDSTWRN